MCFPFGRYRWTKDGEQFDPKQVQGIKQLENSGTLIIHASNGNVPTRFNGLYRCYASNILGTAVSSESRIIVESEYLSAYPKVSFLLLPPSFISVPTNSLPSSSSVSLAHSHMHTHSQQTFLILALLMKLTLGPTMMQLKVSTHIYTPFPIFLRNKFLPPSYNKCLCLGLFLFYLPGLPGV